ncbi:hypothetical protein [Pelagibacterium lentulum]|uniref:hypothetical protein n=1 Tax=Pelagibacterium lentulum TaxID=2029865 RepID=UPI000F8C95F0|nr:hypothetical protein [Pelagibacterium lentulum]
MPLNMIDKVVPVYAEILATLKIIGALGDNLELAAGLPVADLHVDLVRAPNLIGPDRLQIAPTSSSAQAHFRSSIPPTKSGSICRSFPPPPSALSRRPRMCARPAPRWWHDAV